MQFVLIMFLALACMPEVGQDWPRPPWISSPLAGVFWSWLAVGLLVGWGLISTWRICRDIRANPDKRDRVLRRHERNRWRFQVALFAGFAAILSLAGWGWTVGQFWTWNTSPAIGLPGAELLILAPFFVILVFSWLMGYQVERAFFLASLHSYSSDGIDETALPPLLRNRWNFLLFKFRTPFVLVAIPLMLLLIQKEVSRFYPGLIEKSSTTINALGIVLIGSVFLCMPWMIRLVLNLKPLPEGPLRERLLQTAQRLRFRCSDLLLWNTQGGMANAMVVGVFPWPRYVVFTDRMLEEFTPEEVEAVFGHEIGHVKHQHMLFYLVFLLASSAMLGLLMSWVVPEWLDQGSPQPGESDNFFDLANHYYLRAAPLVLLLLGYIFVVFGFLSRRCERQADIYGCRAGSLTDEVTPRGIHIFMNALEKVALLNGISREKPGYLHSWQHSTIARRVGFLEQMLKDPQVEPSFQRRVFFVKWGLVVGLAMMVCLLTGLGALGF